MPDYIRARDNETGHEVSIPVDLFDDALWTKVSDPATDSAGTPLPPKFRTSEGDGSASQAAKKKENI